MAIDNKTAKILYRRAAETYAQKLKLERKNIKPIKSIFDEILDDFARTYKQYGHIPSLDSYRTKLESHLISLHENTAHHFDDKIRAVMGVPHNEDRVNRRLESHIKGFAAQRSHLMSHAIIDTTRDNFDADIENARDSAEKEGISITNASVALIATSLLTNRFMGRIELISSNETQTAAEKGKRLEYDTLAESHAEFDGRDINDMNGQKMWVAILDDHTREWHADADGQTVSIDEPYDVNGEELMEPKDESMGASEENIINCRCSSEPYFG